MKIPSPVELGLPSKFSEWRTNQEEAIRVVTTSTKRTKVICAPTGFGKQPLAIALALIAAKQNIPTAIVTGGLGLQDQMMKDGQYIGMTDLRGRRHYQCNMREDYSCEQGKTAKCPYYGSVACPCTAAVFNCQRSSIVVTNYDKWISDRRFGDGLSHIQQVIFDEAHFMPEAISRSIQITLHHKEVEDTLAIDFPLPPNSDNIETWKPWAHMAKDIAQAEAMRTQQKIDNVTTPKSSWVRHLGHMKMLARRLQTLALANPLNWIVEEVEGGFQFDVIRPGVYGESMLLLHVPSVIALSATIRPKTLFMTGVAKGLFDFIEFPSEFDPKRCPIYYIPTQFVDRSHPDLSMLWVKHDQIAARRQDRKGIVHTISFARADEIRASSRFAHQMLINPRGEPPTEMIEQFRESGPGTEMVSPSIGTGYDFAMKDCEWQFTAKVPMQPPTKINRARAQDDPDYPYYTALQTLLQIFGRPVRSKVDQCENFIGDMNFGKWFWPKTRHMAPSWFKGFYKEIQTLPPPPEALR